MQHTTGLDGETSHGTHSLSAPDSRAQPSSFKTTGSKENTQGGSAFISLPPELRNRVYNCFFQGIYDIVSTEDDRAEDTGEIDSGPRTVSHWLPYKCIKHLRRYLDLTQACHQIRHECISMLFEAHIAQHNWIMASDDQSAFFQLTNFIRSFTPATAQGIQFCLMFKGDKPDRPSKHSFAGNILDFMKRSYPDPDYFTVDSEMLPLPLTCEYGTFEDGSISPSALVTTRLPTWRHDGCVCDLVGDPKDLFAYNTNGPPYVLTYWIGEFIVLRGRLARLDWNSFNFEFSGHDQERWPNEFTPDEEDVIIESGCIHVAGCNKKRGKKWRRNLPTALRLENETA